MGLVLAPSSSLSLYRRPREGLGALLAAQSSLACSRDAEMAMRSRVDWRLAKSVLEEDCEALPAGPLAVLVGDGRYRCRSRWVRCSVLTASLPEESFWWLTEGIMVAAPPLVVAGLARRCPLAVVVEYANELCGAYRKDSRDERGMVEARPVMSSGQFAGFAESLSRMWGTTVARAAASYIVDGAASPAESTIATLLCLGAEHGGMGLPKPEMNAVIDIPSHLQGLTGKRFVRADLLWRESRVVVEYDSDWAHGNSRALNDDSARRNTLQFLGYTVVSATRLQLFNWEKFQLFASSLGEMLGQPIRLEGREDECKRVWAYLARPARFGNLA